jgi:hypothetical protein
LIQDARNPKYKNVEFHFQNKFEKLVPLFVSITKENVGMAAFNDKNGSLSLISFYFIKILVLLRKGVVNIDVILEACRRRKVSDSRYSETGNT